MSELIEDKDGFYDAPPEIDGAAGVLERLQLDAGEAADRALIRRVVREAEAAFPGPKRARIGEVGGDVDGVEGGAALEEECMIEIISKFGGFRFIGEEEAEAGGIEEGEDEVAGGAAVFEEAG